MPKPIAIAGPEALARALKESRKGLAATQEDLANLHGISRYTIVDAESGAGDPKLSTLLTLLNGLGYQLMAVPSQLVHDVSGMEADTGPDESADLDIDDWDFDMEGPR